jgi:hypothetical protein
MNCAYHTPVVCTYTMPNGADSFTSFYAVVPSLPYPSPTSPLYLGAKTKVGRHFGQKKRAVGVPWSFPGSAALFSLANHGRLLVVASQSFPTKLLLAFAGALPRARCTLCRYRATAYSSSTIPKLRGKAFTVNVPFSLMNSYPLLRV